MPRLKSLDGLEPKERKYLLIKQVSAVSIADALRKERTGLVITVQEVENETEVEEME